MNLLRILWQPLFWLYGYFALISCLLFFALGGIIYTVVCATASLVVPSSSRGKVGKDMLRGLLRFYVGLIWATGLFRVDLRELKSLMDTPGGLILAPNHPSLLDAIVMIAHLPGIQCIIKSKIWDSPILGGGARLAGYIRNDSPTSLVKQSARSLQRGEKLLLFPEGTRTRNRHAPLNPLKPGIGLIAVKAQAPVQTILIRTNSNFLGKDWPIWKKPPMPVRFEMRLGQKLTPREGERAKEFVARLEKYYRSELS